MKVLFVHGMGRSPLSAWPMLWRLRQAGLGTSTFGYFVSREDFSEIVVRLLARITCLADQGDYAVIGHSLGGVLLREAISQLPPSVPRPCHLFLLGSPVRPARLAQRLNAYLAFRLLTADCGQLLGSVQRMAAVERSMVPTTAVIGIKGLPFAWGPFGGEPNDGIVAVSEGVAEWLTDQVHIDVPHVFLPSSQRVAEIVLQRLLGRPLDPA